VLESKIFGFLYLFRSGEDSFKLHFGYGDRPDRKVADRGDCLVIKCKRTLPHFAYNRLKMGLKRHFAYNPERYLLTPPVFSELSKILGTDDDVPTAIEFLKLSARSTSKPSPTNSGR
jgi:hypothetical protein